MTTPGHPLSIRYDPTSDYATIYFAAEARFPEYESTVATPDEWSIRNAHVVVMFSSTGQLLAMEIGGASRVLYPELLERLVKNSVDGG